MADDPFAGLIPLDQPSAAPSPSIGRPIIRRASDLPKPNLPEGWQIGTDGVARPVVGLPPEFTQPKPEGTDAPSGYRFKADGALEPIPGGPADKTRPSSDINLQATLDEMAGVVKAARRAKERSKGWFMTGFGADLIGGNTPAGRSLRGDLQTIGASTAFERLQRMRQESPTGGALGQIAVKELEMLRDSVAALDPGQSDVDFQRNMDTIAERYSRIYERLGGDPALLADDDDAPAAAPAPSGAAPREGGQPPLGGDPGPTQPPLTPSNDGTRAVIDEKKKAIGDKIAALVSKGADRNTIMGFAVRLDPSLREDPRFRGWVDEALKYRKANPGARFPVDPSFYTTQVPLTTSEQIRNDAAQSAAGAAVMRAGNAVTGNSMDEIAEALGGDPEQVRRALATAGEQHPIAALAGDISGSVMGAMAGEAALARLGIAPSLIRSSLGDMGFGAVSGAGAADDGDRLTGAAKGAAAGLGGSLTGRAVTSTVGRAVRGVADPSVGYVVREKIPLTLGQAVGNSGRFGAMVKAAEDRLSGIPAARRAEGITAMNSKAFDQALKPIGGSVGDTVGEEAVEKAQTLVGKAFTKALSGKSASVDYPFVTQAASAKRAIQAIPRVGGDVEDSIDDIVRTYFDANGAISGENMQAVLRELGEIKRAYRNDPLGNRIGKAVGMVEASIENLFRRQASEVMPQYNAAKQAFRRLSIVEDAVLRAKNKGGVFTASQLGLADRANAKKFSGTHAAAAGKGEFHDFQRAMQNVLPSEVPDSGRLAMLTVPGVLAGSGAGLGYALGDPQSGASAGLTLAGLLALAYSRLGQRGLVAAATKRGPAAKAAGTAIRERARLGGLAGATAAVQETSRDR